MFELFCWWLPLVVTPSCCTWQFVTFKFWKCNLSFNFLCFLLGKDALNLSIFLSFLPLASGETLSVSGWQSNCWLLRQLTHAMYEYEPAALRFCFSVSSVYWPLTALCSCTCPVFPLHSDVLLVEIAWLFQNCPVVNASYSYQTGSLVNCFQMRCDSRLYMCTRHLLIGLTVLEVF